MQRRRGNRRVLGALESSQWILLNCRGSHVEVRSNSLPSDARAAAPVGEAGKPAAGVPKVAQLIAFITEHVNICACTTALEHEDVDMHTHTRTDNAML